MHDLRDQRRHLFIILCFFTGDADQQVPGQAEMVPAAVFEECHVCCSVVPLVHQVQQVVVQAFNTRLHDPKARLHQLFYVPLLQVCLDLAHQGQLSPALCQHGQKMLHRIKAQNIVCQLDQAVPVPLAQPEDFIPQPLGRLVAVDIFPSVQPAEAAGVLLPPPAAAGALQIDRIIRPGKIEKVFVFLDKLPAEHRHAIGAGLLPFPLGNIVGIVRPADLIHILRHPMRDRIGNRFAAADHPIRHGSGLQPHGNAADLCKDLVPLAEEDIVDAGIMAQDGRPRLTGDIGSAEYRSDAGRNLLHPFDHSQRAVDLRKNRADRQHPRPSPGNLKSEFFDTQARLFPGVD